MMKPSVIFKVTGSNETKLAQGYFSLCNLLHSKVHVWNSEYVHLIL